MRHIKLAVVFTLVTISLVLTNCTKEKSDSQYTIPEVKAFKSDSKGERVSVTTNAIMSQATGPDAQCVKPESTEAFGTLRQIVFSATLPSSLFYNFSFANAADLEVFAQDCCISDDVVEVYINGCLIGTSSSINFPNFGHPGDVFRVTLPAGNHQIEYRNIVSGVGPSGWNVNETEFAPSTVMIGSCNSGVPNLFVTCGKTIVDCINEAKIGVKNHGGFVSKVAHLTNQWVASGLITGAQKDAIMSCVGSSNKS